MSQPSLDIVLPCYNPQDGWAQTIFESLTKINSGLPDAKIGLIVVNDGSTKNIKEDLTILKNKIPSLEVISYPENKGKGFAVRQGVGASTADVVVYTDIDFPYKEEGLIKIYHAVSSNQFDIALAARDENYYKNVPFARRIISKIFKQVVKYTLNIPTTDTQAGLKGFNEKGKDIFIRTTINRYLFDLEFIWLAAREKDIRFAFEPVKIKEGIVFRKMNWKVLFSESFNFLRIFLRPS